MANVSHPPQLITYPDSLGGSVPALCDLLEGGLAGWFGGGVHLLPPFPSSADRGFAPIRYDRIDEAFGEWDDLRRLARCGPLTLDVMVNHMSRLSDEFRDVVRRGRRSEWSDLFLWPDKVWPGGEVPPDDLQRLFLRKPDHPFLEIVVDETGETERVWATFGSSATESDQIDLDWRSPLALGKFEEWFAGLAEVGASELRLDAVGYVVKRAGTSCFMVEPEIWEALDAFVALAGRHGLDVLPEIHAEPSVLDSVAERGYPVYDFRLPALMVDALLSADTARLAEHLRLLPNHAITTLDTHDGIPIQPDLTGVLPLASMVEIRDRLVERGANVNRILGAAERGIEFDAHQINIAYIDAAGGDDAYLVARAIQLFAPGRAQVYYQGLLGGHNDPDGAARTGEGRAINRRDYTPHDARTALDGPVAQRQGRLLELRSTHPAFGAERPEVTRPSASEVRLRWEHEDAWCTLTADVAAAVAVVDASPAVPGASGPI